MIRRLPPKQIGERAECAFLNEAIQRGFTVSKPFGDSAPYDFIVDPDPHRRNGKVWKVQVKSATHIGDNVFRANLAHMRESKRVLLRPHEADFLAAYVAPLKLWYLVPTCALIGHQVIRLYPAGRQVAVKEDFEPYRNAWSLLRASRLPDFAFEAPCVVRRLRAERR